MFNEALTELARELGFEYYAYLNLQPVGTFAVSNYSPEWQDRYFSKSFSEIDPVVLIAKSTMRAFTWSSENTRKVRSRRVRQFYLDAAGFGIRSGITIPVATGLSGILCGGPVSSVEEPLAKDDGELCLCLDPFPRRPFPLLGRVVKNEI
ncbi:autoinducer binding domain-containing protein (plasmid) [Sinorhizobium meliloti]|nr:autoinducer binding domain-containing protein [Sinorhizobium meliloti]WQO97951.1 autoinducer binding domain-containing protein [Sinorhizobium meliloti]